MFLPNIVRSGGSARADADQADRGSGAGDAEGLLERRAVAHALEDGVAAHPPRISWTAATPSSPRSATTWVAPNFLAIACRGSCRDIAITVSAPLDAASTPHSPTAPSPTTTAVPPSRTPAATAACQPVAITSDSASNDGTRSSSGTPSVFTRLPSAWVTRAYSAWPPG